MLLPEAIAWCYCLMLLPNAIGCKSCPRTNWTRSLPWSWYALNTISVSRKAKLNHRSTNHTCTPTQTCSASVIHNVTAPIVVPRPTQTCSASVFYNVTAPIVVLGRPKLVQLCVKLKWPAMHYAGAGTRIFLYMSTITGVITPPIGIITPPIVGIPETIADCYCLLPIAWCHCLLPVACCLLPIAFAYWFCPLPMVFA